MLPMFFEHSEIHNERRLCAASKRIVYALLNSRLYHALQFPIIDRIQDGVTAFCSRQMLPFFRAQFDLA
ncbi:hypothetical protein WH47_11810 [Habropoda laboriosa]|uniref:Uncharacterized protein n=1 Tax=Habropoda laboriosa TaxID=597456 RepID=A0A0L7R8J6_9HYME|nr:hypothetical protein WH47_11810 [Habropoda laboriosa]